MPEVPFERLESMVGESHVSVEGLAIEVGKVEEFARSLKNDDPAFRSERAARERGFDAIPAPITFLRTGLFPRYGPGELGDTDEDPDRFTMGFDLGFEPGYRIHGEQEYEVERPLLVGDTLTGTSTLADVSRHEGPDGTVTVAVLETEYADEGGAHVATERKTILELPGAIEDLPEGDGERRAPGTAGRGGGDDDRTAPAAGDVAVGDTGPELSASFDLKGFVKYAGASCGFDPIHYDRDFVREAGYPDAFAHGMLTAGVVEHMVTDWLGLPSITGLRTRFTDPVWPGDTITVRGEVVGKRDTGGGAAVEAELAATTGDGSRVVEGEATADLPAGGGPV